jgi:hypothetical protein
VITFTSSAILLDISQLGGAGREKPAQKMQRGEEERKKGKK